MFRETYAILRIPRADPSEIYRGGDVLSYGLESTAGEVEADVEIEDLGADEVDDLRKDESVKGLAPAMEIVPIEPVAADEEAEEVERGAAVTWGIQAIGANDCPYTGAGITVAVLDSGIDAEHEAFAGVTLIQKDFTVDGHPAHCPDDLGHGTHCAGTFFGRAVSGKRIGVARGVKTAVIGKIFGAEGGGTTAEVYAAIDWAADEGAQIISMSMALNFAGYLDRLQQSDFPSELAISKALAAYRENMLFFDRMAALLEHHPKAQPLLIAAAGNDSQRHKRADFEISAGMPAAANDIVAVGALARIDDSTLSVTDFSNVDVDVVAPGSAIDSAQVGGGLCNQGGTSMATPHVAGVAALWAQKRLATARRVDRGALRALLVGQATEIGLASGLKTRAIGTGLVQAPRV